MEAKLSKIACEVLGVEPAELLPGAELERDLGMDSLDRMELTIRMESELLDDDEIGEDIAASWKTVSDLEASAKKMMALSAASRR